MTITTLLKITLTAVAMIATAAQAQAETGFATLAGIQAEPMNAEEMEAAQGKFIPCVSEICGGAGGIFSGSAFAGVDIAPSSSTLVFADIAAAYPWVWYPLHPGFPAGSGGIAGVDALLGQTLGDIEATLGIVGLGF